MSPAPAPCPRAEVAAAVAAVAAAGRTGTEAGWPGADGKAASQNCALPASAASELNCFFEPVSPLSCHRTSENENMKNAPLDNGPTNQPNRPRRRGSRGGARRGPARKPSRGPELMEPPELMRPPTGPEAISAVPRPPSALPFGHEFYVVPARPTMAPTPPQPVSQEGAAEPLSLTPPDVSLTPVEPPPPAEPSAPAAPVAEGGLPPLAPEIPDPYSQPPPPRQGHGHQREDPRRAHLKQYLEQREQSGSPAILQPPGGPSSPSVQQQTRPEIYRPQQPRPQHQPPQRQFSGPPQGQPQPPRVPQKPASPQSVEQAVRHVERIIDTLKRTLDTMEEVLDSLEIARLRGEAEEREIQDLTRALTRMQRMEDRPPEQPRHRPPGEAQSAAAEEPATASENEASDNDQAEPTQAS